jgi:hypothetical protein
MIGATGFGGISVMRRKSSVIQAIQIAVKGILTQHEMRPLERLNDPKNEKVPIRWEPELAV